MNAKRIFIIMLVLLVLIGGTLVVYNFFIKPGTTGNNGTGNGALPSSEPGERGGTPEPSLPTGTAGATPAASSLAALKIKPISKEKILGAAIDTDGATVKYFARTNGNLYQTSFDGLGTKTLSSVALQNLVKALWSPDKEKIIGVFLENNNPKKYFYDYKSSQSATLDEKIGYIAWSPDSKKIAYQFTDPAAEPSNISVANPDSTGWKNIFKTRLANLIVEWPAKEKISLRQQPSGLAQGILYVVNPETGDFSRILSDIFGLNLKWSPKADKILYSFTDSRGRNPSLALSDEKGEKFKDLKLAGLADKCVWGKDDRTIYCALPQAISPNAIWPDDYYKGLVVLADDFYKINLETDEKTKIIGSGSENSYDAQDLFLSPKEDYLFFTNRRDGLLYSLKLY